MIKNYFYNIIIFFTAIIFCLFISDWILALLKFPSEIPQRISHPKNYEKVINNIEFQYVFKTNDQGLRYHNIPLEKSNTGYRIFVAGDSMTEGVGVVEGYRFTDLLEEKFISSTERVFFINGGLAGAGPLQYGRLFLKVGLKYNPDALLICVFPNDVFDTPVTLARDPYSEYSPSVIRKTANYIWPRIYILLRKYLVQREYRGKTETSDFVRKISNVAKELNIPQPRIDKWKESLPQELVEAVNKGKYLGVNLSYGLLYPRYLIESIDIASDKARKQFENITKMLSELIMQSELRGIQSAVILLPFIFQCDPYSHSKQSPWTISGFKMREEWLSEDTEIQRQMRRWAKLQGVSFLDLTPVFRKAIQSNKNLYWELDGHWNHMGHQIAAEAILSWLLDQQVFSFINN